MISNSYQKFTTFHTGDYSVFFMKEFLSNKDSSDEIIGQSQVGNIVNFAYKICRHRLYTGCKGCRIIGVSGFRHKRRTRPFKFSVYEECAQLFTRGGGGDMNSYFVINFLSYGFLSFLSYGLCNVKFLISMRLYR